MNTFAEIMASNPPRLVVLFRRGGDGGEQFQWGIVGSIPILTLIGHIHLAQTALVQEEGFMTPDPNACAFILTWDAERRGMHHFLHPDIPEVPLAGMLETIKSALVMSRMGQMMAAQQTRSPAILGPNGVPIDPRVN